MEIKTTITVDGEVYKIEAHSFELHDEKMGSIQRFIEYNPVEPDPSDLYRQGVDDSLTEIE